jgi:DNA (cytosine-5)-methyltransferase 1
MHGYRIDYDSEPFVLAGTLGCNPKAAGSATQQDAHAGLLVAHCLRANGRNAWDESRQTYVVASPLRAEGFDASEDGTGRQNLVVSPPFAFHGSQDPDVSGDVTPPLGRNQGQEACGLAFAERGRKEGRTLEVQENLAYALANPSSGGGTHSRRILAQSAVRRLLPVESERLMGLPDGYTDVPFKGRPAADAPRYRAIGNSIPVPLLEWHGRRIETALRLVLNKERL